MMADLTATYDAKAALPANRYAKSGETFAGWNTKADGSGAMYRNKAEVTNLASGQDDVVVPVRAMGGRHDDNARREEQ